MKIIILATLVAVGTLGACTCAFLAGRESAKGPIIDLPEEFSQATAEDIYTVTADTTNGVITYHIGFAMPTVPDLTLEDVK